jgi:hypothetical protein
MIDIETKLRAGLHALADASPVVEVPSVDLITSRAREPRRRRGLGRRTAILVVAGVIGTAGVATATGVLPLRVSRSLTEFEEWGFATSGDARRVASVTHDGVTHEVWRAPLADGRECVFNRVIGSENDDAHAGAHCGISGNDEDRAHFWAAGYPAGRLRPGDVASGRLPLDAIAAVFVFDDGTTYIVQPQREGFFITAFERVPAGKRITRLDAMRPDGTVYTPPGG